MFAGCGGFSYGFEQAGFHVGVASDYDPSACRTWARNHTGRIIEGDITRADILDVVSEVAAGSSIIIGGPPCVAYSMSGSRDPKDPRGRLFEQYVEVVRRVQPLGFLMENVPGLLSMEHEDGMVAEIICKRMGGLGYEVGHKLLVASDYGVPQDRKRVFFVGFLKGSGIIFGWPEPTHGEGLLPRVTVRDAIGDLSGAPWDKDMHHYPSRHTPAFVRKIRGTPVGRSVTSNYAEVFFRAWPDRPAPTIKANNGSVLVHWEHDRCMTPRELARLQGFPDSFGFCGSKHDVLIQIGNAVPVGLAKVLGERMALALGG